MKWYQDMRVWLVTSVAATVGFGIWGFFILSPPVESFSAPTARITSELENAKGALNCTQKTRTELQKRAEELKVEIAQTLVFGSNPGDNQMRYWLPTKEGLWCADEAIVPTYLDWWWEVSWVRTPNGMLVAKLSRSISVIIIDFALCVVTAILYVLHFLQRAPERRTTFMGESSMGEP